MERSWYNRTLSLSLSLSLVPKRKFSQTIKIPLSSPEDARPSSTWLSKDYVCQEPSKTSDFYNSANGAHKVSSQEEREREREREREDGDNLAFPYVILASSLSAVLHFTPSPTDRFARIFYSNFDYRVSRYTRPSWKLLLLRENWDSILAEYFWVNNEGTNFETNARPLFVLRRCEK